MPNPRGLCEGNGIFLPRRDHSWNRHRFFPRHREHGDILRCVTDLPGKRPALSGNLVPDDPPHGLLGFDPRPARLAPSRRIEHVDVDSQPGALGHCVLRRGLPLGREHLDRPQRVAAVVDVADHRKADAGLFHRLEILRDPVARDVGFIPIPITPRLGLLGWVLELLLERFRSVESARKKESKSQEQCRFFHGLDGVCAFSLRSFEVARRFRINPARCRVSHRSRDAPSRAQLAQTHSATARSSTAQAPSECPCRLPKRAPC